MATAAAKLGLGYTQLRRGDEWLGMRTEWEPSVSVVCRPVRVSSPVWFLILNVYIMINENAVTLIYGAGPTYATGDCRNSHWLVLV